MPFDTIAGSVAGGILGIAMQGANDERQLNMNQQLLNQQRDADFAKMSEAQRLQYEYWKKTNYKAQKEEMIAAGLNPALLYGMGGSGGGTTSQAGQSVGSQHAPTGGREVQDFGAMGLQAAQAAAQIELTKAETENTKVDTAKKAGVDTELVESSIGQIAQTITESKARTELTNVEASLKRIQANIQGSTQEEQIRSIGLEMQKSSEVFDRLVRENAIGRETYNTLIERARQELVETGVNIELKKAGITKTEAEIKEISAKISKMDNDVYVEQKNAETNRMNAESNSTNAGTGRGKLQLETYLHDITDSNKEVMAGISKLLQALALKGVKIN